MFQQNLPHSSPEWSEWMFVSRNKGKNYELWLSLTTLVTAQTMRIIYGMCFLPFKKKIIVSLFCYSSDTVSWINFCPSLAFVCFVHTQPGAFVTRYRKFSDMRLTLVYRLESDNSDKEQQTGVSIVILVCKTQYRIGAH